MGTSNWGSLKSMIYHRLGWKRPWFPQRSHDSSQAGKAKRGSCKGWDLGSLIPQGFLTVKASGRGGFLSAQLEGQAEGVVKPDADQGHLRIASPVSRGSDRTPAPSLISQGLHRKQKRRFYLLPFPFKCTSHSSQLSVVCSHSFLQLLSHLFPIPLHKS